MASTRGRAVVIPLTNKSGGSVAAGDVVIVDTGNNDAFTTSTAGAVTGGVGVAQETIASNATGRVLIAGYAALVNTSASVTRGNYGKTHTVVKQAVDAGASRVAGTFCQFLTGGTTPTARIFSPDLGAAAGNVAADAIWDAAGDLAVGSGSDAAAKLSIGAVGGALSRINGVVAWNSGTSFPGSKATGDRYYRSDLGMEFYWDGTRWLCMCLHKIPFTERVNVATGGLTATGTVGNAPTLGAAGDQYLVDFRVAAFASGGGFDGTNFWVVTLDKLTTANAATNVGSLTFNSLTVNNWINSVQNINAVVSGAAHVAYRIIATKTLSPGNLILGVDLTYRIVGT